MISFIIGAAKPASTAIRALGRFVGGIESWLQARRDFGRLCELSERDLRDLGLRGSDLRDASAVPYFGDPTAIISLGAEERRGLAGGEGVDDILRGLSAGSPSRLERIAKESDSGDFRGVVCLGAAD